MKFEYHIFIKPIEQSHVGFIVEFGRDGWEYVEWYAEDKALFKRSIEETKNALSKYTDKELLAELDERSKGHTQTLTKSN